MSCNPRELGRLS